MSDLEHYIAYMINPIAEAYGVIHVFPLILCFSTKHRDVFSLGSLHAKLL